MTRNFPRIPFERYADDVICHCKSAEEARALWSVLADRFTTCKLVLHPEKTKIVYCKDANRRGDFPNQSFDFLGFTFRARRTLWQGGLPAHGFMPAVSSKALKTISRTIRRWTLHHHSDKSLENLAATYNPYITGWINYFGHFYRTQLRPALLRIDAYLIRWARRKFKRLRGRSNLAPDPAHRILAYGPAKQRLQRTAHPARVGAGEVGGLHTVADIASRPAAARQRQAQPCRRLSARHPFAAQETDGAAQSRLSRSTVPASRLR